MRELSLSCAGESVASRPLMLDDDEEEEEEEEEGPTGTLPLAAPKPLPLLRPNALLKREVSEGGWSAEGLRAEAPRGRAGAGADASVMVDVATTEEPS